MSEPLLNVMKIMLLAGLYLFFVRVLWSVFSELRDPRSVIGKRGRARSGHSQAAVPADSVAPAAPAFVQAGGPTGPSSPADFRPPAPAGVPAGRLTVIEPPNLAGITYTLGPEITIGRAPTNGIPLDDTYVSTVHARIFCTSGTFFIEDLASRNGSMLNGAPLVATTPLMPGDRIQVGATAMEFE